MTSPLKWMFVKSLTLYERINQKNFNYIHLAKRTFNQPYRATNVSRVTYTKLTNPITGKNH